MNRRSHRVRGAVAAALLTWLDATTAGAQAPVAPAAARMTAAQPAGAPFAAASSQAAPPATFASSPSASPTSASPALAASPSAAPATASSPTAPPVAAESTEDIRDIRGPKYIAPIWLWPAVFAGAALLAAGAYGLRRWLRRRRRPRALLPFEEALQRLEEIRALMQPASAREFSIAVSDIVRRYIEQRFFVTATHRTTEEFLHDLLDSSHPALTRHRALLAEFLQQCDLVKFAGMSLSIRGMESLHDSARAFVLETAKPDQPVETSPRPDTQETHDSLPAT